MDMVIMEKMLQNAFDKAFREIYEMRNMRSESDMKRGAMIFRNAIAFEIESYKSKEIR